jgi:aspartoacylase
MQRPIRIAIVGGVHGNERGGILLVEEMRRRPQDWIFPGLKLETFLGNPAAIAANRRYLETDLNRCFGPGLLVDLPVDAPLEERRARELRELLTPAGAPFDLVVDLHNTTAAMGICWILTSGDPWPWYLGAKAREADTRVNLYFTPETFESNVFLPSLGRSEITLEIGPAVHGTPVHWAYEAARSQLRLLLETLSRAPEGFDPVATLETMDFPLFVEGDSVGYPRSADGSLGSVVHQDLLGRDFQRIDPGHRLFHSLDEDRPVAHEGEPFWPVFVAEAAYVEKGIAFVKTNHRSWQGGKDILP